MRVIHRYPIPRDKNVVTLKLPKDAEILAFAAKNNELNLWLTVETSNEDEERKFCLVWTGRQPPPPPSKYIGMAQTFENSAPPGHGAGLAVVIVWHLFEIGNKEIGFEPTSPAWHEGDAT